MLEQTFAAADRRQLRGALPRPPFSFKDFRDQHRRHPVICFDDTASIRTVQHAHPGDALSSRQRLVYVLILGALTALGPFTIDLYLRPSPCWRASSASRRQPCS